MSTFRKGSALVVLVALVALAAAVSAFGRPGATTTVGVTAGKPSEFKFTLSKKSAVKGTVVFNVTNKGAIKHDFKISGKKTPLLATGKKGTLKVVLNKAGKYAFLCTVTGHAAAGMKGTFTIK